MQMIAILRHVARITGRSANLAFTIGVKSQNGCSRDDDVFFEHSKWKLTELGRSASTDTLRSIILQDPPLEIALWDAMFEARDVGDNCGGCEPDDPLLLEHRRLLAHLLDRVERIRAAGHI